MDFSTLFEDVLRISEDFFDIEMIFWIGKVDFSTLFDDICAGFQRISNECLVSGGMFGDCNRGPIH